MTKKDYKIIAEVLNESVEGARSHVDRKIRDTEMETTVFIAERLSKKLKADNSNFDKEKFMEACGL